MPKKLLKDIGRFAGASMLMGASGLPLAKLSQQSGIDVGGGLSAASSMMPVIGSTMMLGHTVRLTKKVLPKIKRFKL